MTTELKNRILWAAIPSAIVLLTVLVLGQEAIYLVCLGCALVGWREYSRMMGLRERPAFYYAGFAFLTAMLSYFFFLGPLTLIWLWMIWLIAFFILFFEPWFNSKLTGLSADPALPSIALEYDPNRDWTHLCRFVLGLVYVVLIFGFIPPIGSKVHGQELIILGLATVFFGDTMAYFCGKKWGKHKLWPALSPKKTVEGALAGWIGSFAASLIVYALFRAASTNCVSLTMCGAFGFLAAPLAQAGDFLESLMKRASGFKDSGTLLPGHGGILDRTDGLVFVMPFLYFLF